MAIVEVVLRLVNDQRSRLLFQQHGEYRRASLPCRKLVNRLEFPVLPDSQLDTEVVILKQSNEVPKLGVLEEDRIPGKQVALSGIGLEPALVNGW